MKYCWLAIFRLDTTNKTLQGKTATQHLLSDIGKFLLSHTLFLYDYKSYISHARLSQNKYQGWLCCVAVIYQGPAVMVFAYRVTYPKLHNGDT